VKCSGFARAGEMGLSGRSVKLGAQARPIERLSFDCLAAGIAGRCRTVGSGDGRSRWLPTTGLRVRQTARSHRGPLCDQTEKWQGDLDWLLAAMPGRVILRLR